jgi:hypothetical protein
MMCLARIKAASCRRVEGLGRERGKAAGQTSIDQIQTPTSTTVRAARASLSINLATTIDVGRDVTAWWTWCRKGFLIHRLFKIESTLSLFVFRSYSLFEGVSLFMPFCGSLILIYFDYMSLFKLFFFFAAVTFVILCAILTYFQHTLISAIS